MDNEKGDVESVDGWWHVSWNHEGNSYMTYTVRDNDSGYEYVARFDDGWRIAPRGMATVDMERLIGDQVQAFDPELEGLVQTLNLASGRSL